MQHFLTTESLTLDQLTAILDTAESFINADGSSVKKVPLLRGKTIVNLFFEASTRTRSTFELAAKRLSADILTMNIAASATVKGESLLDTLRNLEAMHVDMFVVRHQDSGAAEFLSQHISPGISVINAGDGRHAHPTQAMLDMFTIRRHKGAFDQLKVTIVGDLLHSRVARSQIHALRTLGAKEIRVVAPRTLMPTQLEALAVDRYDTVESALTGTDVIITLRLQKERMQGALLPSEREYFQLFGLTPERVALAAKDAIVMHPGPINRGVEISSAVADGEQSVILQQVSYGIAVRMAVMSMLAGH